MDRDTELVDEVVPQLREIVEALPDDDVLGALVTMSAFSCQLMMDLFGAVAVNRTLDQIRAKIAEDDDVPTRRVH